LRPRTSRPQDLTPANAATIPTLYLKGTTTHLKPNDRLLLVWGKGKDQQKLRQVQAIEARTIEDRTVVTLYVPSPPLSPARETLRGEEVLARPDKSSSD